MKNLMEFKAGYLSYQPASVYCGLVGIGNAGKGNEVGAEASVQDVPGRFRHTGVRRVCVSSSVEDRGCQYRDKPQLRHGYSPTLGRRGPATVSLAESTPADEHDGHRGLS